MIRHRKLLNDKQKFKKLQNLPQQYTNFQQVHKQKPAKNYLPAVRGSSPNSLCRSGKEVLKLYINWICTPLSEVCTRNLTVDMQHLPSPLSFKAIVSYESKSMKPLNWSEKKSTKVSQMLSSKFLPSITYESNAIAFLFIRLLLYSSPQNSHTIPFL